MKQSLPLNRIRVQKQKIYCIIIHSTFISASPFLTILHIDINIWLYKSFPYLSQTERKINYFPHLIHCLPLTSSMEHAVFPPCIPILKIFKIFPHAHIHVPTSLLRPSKPQPWSTLFLSLLSLHSNTISVTFLSCILFNILEHLSTPLTILTSKVYSISQYKFPIQYMLFISHTVHGKLGNTACTLCTITATHLQ